MKSYQIWASKVEGKPVFRKISRTSNPDTNPSLSLSVFRKMSSYLAFSAGDTTHCRGKCTYIYIYYFCQSETNIEVISFNP